MTSMTAVLSLANDGYKFFEFYVGTKVIGLKIHHLQHVRVQRFIELISNT